VSNEVHSDTPQTELPGEARAYRLDDGSGRAHLLLGEVGRTLAGAEETGGAMSVMSLCGPAADRPIPMHSHEREHDVFLCVRGRIQVWAGDESRILTPGDLASVPPGILHAYRLLDHFSQFVGPIVPAGWDRFFDLTGTPYAGAAYPQVDPTPPPFAKFGQAQQQFHMRYVQDAPYAEATVDAPDDTLPGAEVAYFLRAGEGPRHTLFGQVCFQLLTGAESDGQLGMTVTEGPAGDPTPAHVHARTAEAIICLEGRMRVWADGEEHALTRGDFVNVPPGVEHAYACDGHLTRFTTMHSPSGLEHLFALAGEVSQQRIFPAASTPVDLQHLADAASPLDIRFAER
jgi:quercetin dioxygenase-like cupin family protein